MEAIREDSRNIKVWGQYDVLVIGGGAAGISAAVASARAGAKTLLVEKHGFLGGIATAGIVGSFCGFFTSGDEKKPIVGGIARTLLDILDVNSGVSEKRVSKVNPRLGVYQYNPEVLKYAADRLATEAGAELLFHAIVCGVIPGDRNTLKGVFIENKSGRYAVLSKVVIDATGDGDAAAMAGVPFELGDGQGSGQAMTAMFRLVNVDFEKFEKLDRTGLREKLSEVKQSGEFKFSRIDPVIGPALPVGVVQVNLTGISGLDGTNAKHLTEAEVEGRRQVFEYLRFFRKYEPGFENAEVVDIGSQVGVRETRRIMGDYVLKEKEMLAGKKFTDGIALGAWPVEFHDPQSGKIVWKYLDVNDDYYSIPMGCIIANNVANLLMAGRCISTTHIAQASTRVIGPALALGEAAGTLAAISVDSETDPGEIHPEHVRKSLTDHGAVLEV